MRAALSERAPRAQDVVIVFCAAGYDVEELLAAAGDEAAPARVVGCTSMRSFTDTEQVPSGCLAALLTAEDCAFGICHLERDDADIAGTARRAAETARERAGAPLAHAALLLLTDGLTPDQREVAHGAYEVTTALIPFVGGAAADDLTWSETHTFGDGRVLRNGIAAVWINSARPIGVSVDHGWSPVGRPMLVTRAQGTIVHELDGMPAFAAYAAERGGGLDPDDPELFLKLIDGPVGSPNAHGRYDVRQLHAFLPGGGGINFNAGVSEQSILQLMSADATTLLEGARRAARQAVAQLREPARTVLVFSCGSRVPLLGDRAAAEAEAISAELHGAPVCGFYTYGEFARVTGSGGVHNSSVAVLAM
ncbi:MAG: FIST C-terminal domain-containing protein [Solirubrobacterales bacterium]|nr:FIST C-terminal domain-containing protein [Solirubrobacterales bacterium]